jgi:hypothetical protein
VQQKVVDINSKNIQQYVLRRGHQQHETVHERDLAKKQLKNWNVVTTKVEEMISLSTNAVRYGRSNRQNAGSLNQVELVVPSTMARFFFILSFILCIRDALITVCIFKASLNKLNRNGSTSRSSILSFLQA